LAAIFAAESRLHPLPRTPGVKKIIHINQLFLLACAAFSDRVFPPLIRVAVYVAQ